MTQEQWFADPENPAFLAELLRHPRFQAALAVVEHMSYHRRGTSTEPNMITDNGDSFAGKILGYCKAQENLLSLAYVPEPDAEQLREKYLFHGQKENEPTE